MIPTKETLKLKAFHGDKSLKSDLVKEIKWHKEQDKIIQGTYETNGKYCAVGCSIHSLNVKKGTSFNCHDHTIYETQLGIPESLARLEDIIFEGLTKEKCAEFPLKFIQAIPVGANLAMVAPKFIIFVLNDCLKNAEPDGVKAITTAIKLWSSVVAGKNPKPASWSAARSAAESAAWSAAESAARSAAWSAAESAARSAAESAARSAARSAGSAAGLAAWSAGSAAGSAARSAAYGRYANKLISLLKECK
jgi:hypothetical protein